jgi:DNA-binding beta-propeller fold protein YncE
MRENAVMSSHLRHTLGTGIVAILAICSLSFAQTSAPTNSLPNPYRSIENWGTLPQGRAWGSTSAVTIDPDGTTVWVAERCGESRPPSRVDPTQPFGCDGSNLDPILKFDTSGKLLKSFGAGLLLFPHGIHLDRDGNVWVVDGLGRGTKGHQVFKFSPDGKVLLTLGKAGGNPAGADAEDPESFYQPNDVITYPNGDILVAEGHGGANSRLILFDKGGKFIKQFGKKGTGLQGEFDQPHSLAFDSKGRLFVADRANNRIQILDAKTFATLDTWYQFSRLSGIFIKDDIIYGADSESGSVSPPHYPWKRGIRIGSARDGKVTAFIPDPSHNGLTYEMVDGKVVAKMADGGKPPGGTLAAEGVAVDSQGNIYGAEVGPRKLQRYVKK